MQVPNFNLNIKIFVKKPRYKDNPIKNLFMIVFYSFPTFSGSLMPNLNSNFKIFRYDDTRL